MRITVASGKGGTGKTTVATNMAVSLADKFAVQFLDADVEAPNAHLFLEPRIEKVFSVKMLHPEVDMGLCDLCGECAKACEFSAIAILGDKVLVYDDLCHGCGVCSMVCPKRAITEVPRELGVIEEGTAHGFPFARGVLNVGESIAAPLVHELKRRIVPDRLIITDAPPGTGCPTIAAIEGADVAVLVTEPTPFGLHDLKAAVGVARSVEVPVVVVVNRDGIGDDRVERYCEEEGIPIAAKIPFDREVARLYAEGTLLADELPEWKERFRELFRTIQGVLA